MTEPDQRKKNPLGPTGATVAHNVKRLRTRLDWGFNDLAGRLAELGRPIPPLGLRKIESLQRRVDADDLVALAVALATNPNALLLPPTSNPKHAVTVTAVGERPASDVWQWATGQQPLDDSTVPDSVPEQNRRTYAQSVFQNNTDPTSQDWARSPNVVVITDGD